MRSLTLFLVRVVLALLTTSVAWGASAEDLRGRVVAVADGDTVTVLDANNRQHRVRLNGVDAPELGQPFSQVSKSYMSSLVFEREVLVAGQKVDRYGRLVGTVYIGDKNANLELLRSGLAWYYRDYEGDVPVTWRAVYAAAEAEARSAKRGLWQEAQPAAPWDFRAGTVAPSSAATTLGAVVGNRSSGIYHVPGCRDYGRIAERNRVHFKTEAEAVAAGFRKARNCSIEPHLQ